MYESVHSLHDFSGNIVNTISHLVTELLDSSQNHVLTQAKKIPNVD